jgi:hypothetical protein
MGRTKSIPARRGYPHYELREVEAHHLAYLREFLEFIYGEYHGLGEWWAPLSRLLFNVPLAEIRRRRPAMERALLGAWSLEDLGGIQSSCRRDFEQVMKTLARREPVAVRTVDFKLTPLRAASGEEVWWVGPGVPEIARPEDAHRELMAVLLWSLMYLRCQAILHCEECGRYFLRRDIRVVTYCSSRCRYRQVNRQRTSRRRREVARRKKTRSQ